MKIIKKTFVFCTIFSALLYLNPKISYADIHSNTRVFNGVTLNSSVNNSFIINGTTYYYSNVWEQARKNWHGQAGISLNYSTHNWADKYYVGTTSEPNLIGRVFPVNGYLDYVGMDDYWIFVNAYIYSNTMDSKNMSYAQRISNATHEIGHTLKLKHPTDSTKSSVMKQGIQSIGPTSYDYSELKRKWN